MIRAPWAAAVLAVTACGVPRVSGSSPQAQANSPPGRVTADSTSPTLIPPGLGTLKQEDIAIVLQPNGVRVTAIPLDESIIRVLAPDSYRSLHATLESRRPQIAQRASNHGIRDPGVWYVSFVGLTPDARFVPTDMTVTSGGRDYRPFDVIALTPGFGEHRVQPRDTQRGLLLFDDGIDASQPMVVAMAAERNLEWSNDRSDAILSKIEAERAQIRARAGGRP